MTTTYVQEGETLDWINDSGSAVASGDVVTIGSNGDALLGVAIFDIGIGETGAVSISGVHRLPKVDAAVIGFGEYVLWDSSATAFDDNQAVGAAGDVADGAFAVESKAATVGDTILVKLTGIPGVLS